MKNGRIRVIVSGFLLATILAGFLWYRLFLPLTSLTRIASIPLAETPSPSPHEHVSSPTPTSDQTLQAQSQDTTQDFPPVEPTAPTGSSTLPGISALLIALGISCFVITRRQLRPRDAR